MDDSGWKEKEQRERRAKNRVVALNCSVEFMRGKAVVSGDVTELAEIFERWLNRE